MEKGQPFDCARIITQPKVYDRYCYTCYGWEGGQIEVKIARICGCRYVRSSRARVEVR